MTRPKIITSHEWPPCPWPPFWRAWRDGNEEAGVYGQGNTEQEAISDLEAQEDDDFCQWCDDHCPNKGYWHCPVCDAEWVDEDDE